MINIGICGYGNLGRGIEKAIKLNNDMNLVGVFTRRDPKTVKLASDVVAYHVDDLVKFKDKIDVLILCGGSATDLPTQTPELAKMFNVVDSFDTHAKIYDHFNNIDNNAKDNRHTASIYILLIENIPGSQPVEIIAVLPNGKDYTFWGKGVSQGHSDAIRRIEGVKDARQYTIPKDEALELVRSGANPNLSVRDKHLRDCYVVLEEGADPNKVKQAIVTMPNYFADYDTFVTFISQEELNANHKGIPHGGFVIRTGETSDGVKHRIEYSLQLDSNPEFTSSVMIAYARACYRLNKEGSYGCKTVFDVAPKYLSIQKYDDLLKTIL